MPPLFPNRPATTLPPIVRPTRRIVRDVYEPYVVPVIHPTHTQYNHHKVIQYQHYCPHTVSHCCDVSHQHVNCGCPGGFHR